MTTDRDLAARIRNVAYQYDDNERISRAMRATKPSTESQAPAERATRPKKPRKRP